MYKDTFDKPVVKIASFRFNVILIEFNDDMSKDNNKSYLNIYNYAIQENKIIKSLSDSNKIIEVKKGYFIKIILKEILNPIVEILNIHLGYIHLNKIFYIENEKGLIPYPFNKKNLELVEELNLKDGIFKLIDNKTIKFKYEGNNRFSNIVLNDFYIEKYGQKYSPIIIEFNGEIEIFFIFNKFISEDDLCNLCLNVIDKPKSKDIYGFNIKGNVSIKIYDYRDTFINNFSFCNYDNKTAFLKINFSKPILYFSYLDFLVKYDNKVYKIRYIKSSVNKTVIDICIDNIDIKYFMENIFRIFTCVKYEFIKTLDYRGKKVFIRKEVSSKYFIANSIILDIDKYPLEENEIKVNFNDNILPGSLITNSNFNEEEKAWQGEELTIPKGNLIIDKSLYNISLTLNNNISFGKIIIEGKNLGNSKILTNIEEGLLILKDKGMLIKLNKKEDFLDSFYINNIKYCPFYNIRSIKGYYIFFGYCPSFKMNVKDTIIVSPLKKPEDDPFNGGIKNFNYIINVDNFNKYREYGNTSVTIITGYLNFIGNLNLDEVLTIKNLRVLGKVLIDVKKGSVILDSIVCNDVIYN